MLARVLDRELRDEYKRPDIGITLEHRFHQQTIYNIRLVHVAWNKEPIQVAKVVSVIGGLESLNASRDDEILDTYSLLFDEIVEKQKRLFTKANRLNEKPALDALKFQTSYDELKAV